MKSEGGLLAAVPGRQIMVAAAMAMAFTSVGCSWFKRKADQEATVTEVMQMESAPQDTMVPPTSIEDGEMPRPSGLQSADEFLGRIYFDFDKSDLRADQLAQIQQNVNYMKSNPDQRVLIEGHCDERGTVEYNFGLGERRARTVMDYMVSQGVDASRLQTLSKGEEEPAAAGSNEAAWGLNRRAQFKFILP